MISNKKRKAAQISKLTCVQDNSLKKVDDPCCEVKDTKINDEWKRLFNFDSRNVTIDWIQTLFESLRFGPNSRRQHLLRFSGSFSTFELIFTYQSSLGVVNGTLRLLDGSVMDLFKNFPILSWLNGTFGFRLYDKWDVDNENKWVGSGMIQFWENHKVVKEIDAREMCHNLLKFNVPWHVECWIETYEFDS